MKRIKQWKIYLAVVLSVVLACCLLAACSGWKITLNKNELTLKAGESETLIAECDAEGVELSWSSDNAAVATVSGEGEVVAVAAGTCTVTVTAVKGGEERTATCAVTVSPAPTAAYKVETYVQKDDLSFEKEGETSKSAAIGATVTESPAAREGLIVDKENSVLSATVSADGTTTLKIYYALPYKNLYLVRVDNVASFYRVYEEKGLIVNEQGAEANISEEFAPTADEDGKYYFWNVGGVTSKGTFTKEELLGMKDEALIREGVSADAVFNTAKPNANFTAKDGCFQTEATTKWGESASYLYYTGSSDTFYAKVQVDNLKESGDMDISAGFTLADARNHSKNVQFYFSGSSKGGWLAQNNSYHWEDNDSFRWVVENAAEVPTDAQSNVFEIIVFNGNVAIYSNEKLMFVLPVEELTGAGNEPGVLAETTVFDLGIAQWRFNHTAKFDSKEFACGDAAKTLIEARLPKLSLNKTSLTVFEGDEAESLTASWNSPLVKLDADKIVWDSSNKAVATVENGTVTFIAAGETEITATYQFLGVTLSAKCTVTVQEPANVTLALSETEITAANEKAAAVTLTASWDAEDETLDTSAIVWESGDETVATVAGGVVTFTGIGSTTITARCTYKGRPVRATCSVTVTGTYLFKEDSKNATFNDNGSIDMTNGGGWNPNYTYAKGSGTAFWAETTISATAGKDNDISAGITVKGKDGDSFQLYLANKTIKVNFLHRWAETATETTTKTLLTFTEAYEISDTSSVKMGLAYLDGTFYLYLNNELVHFFTTDALTYVYNSENKQIEIGDNGWTIGLASWHTHKPRFTDSYVTFDAAEATKKVEAHLPELLLSKTSVTVIEGAETQTLTLGWSLTACNIDDSAIVWESSDNAVATVENGKVTFVGVGNATITAKYVFFGETLTAECEVTVEKKPNVELSLNKSEISAANEKAAPEKLTLSWNYAEGQTGPELGDINPASITWSSSDETVATVAGGVVTFKGLGTATINVSYPYEGGTLRTSCSVTVTGTYLFNGELSSKATDNGDGTIDFKTGDGDGGRYAYAKGQGNTFYVSTEITSLNGTQKDVSAGFTIKGKDGDSVQIYLYSDNQWIAINFLYTWGGTNYTWLPEALNKKIEVSNEKAAKMGLAYRDGVFYLFIQDELAYTFSESILTYTKGSEKKTLEPAEDGWSVGIACFEAKGKMRQLRFTNSYVTFCANEVQQKLDELAPKLALDQTTVSAAAGAAAQTLTATLKLTDGSTNNTVYPSKEVKVQWESSNDAVVTVSNGTLAFVGAGTATVTAKYTLPGYGEITATCEVTVTEPVS